MVKEHPGVQEPVRVPRRFDLTHQVALCGTALADEPALLGPPDPVFGADGAARGQDGFEDGVLEQVGGLGREPGGFGAREGG